MLSDKDTQSVNQFDLRYVVDLPIWERRERKELLAQIHAPNVHRRDIQTVASILERGINLAFYACMSNKQMSPFRSTQIQIYYQRFTRVLFHSEDTVNDFANNILAPISAFQNDHSERILVLKALLGFVRNAFEPLFDETPEPTTEQIAENPTLLVMRAELAVIEQSFEPYQKEIEALDEKLEDFRTKRQGNTPTESMMTVRNNILNTCGAVHVQEKEILQRYVELHKKLRSAFSSIPYDLANPHEVTFKGILEAKDAVLVVTPVPEPTELMKKKHLTISFLSLLQSSAEILSKMLKLTRHTDIQIAEDNIDRSIEELLQEIDLDFNKQTSVNEQVEKLRRRVAKVKTNPDLVASVGDWLNERRYGESEFISDHLAEKRQRVMRPIDTALPPEMW